MDERRRRRLGLAILVPEPLSTEIDGVRRALGDPARHRIAPHITLLPPFNATEGRLVESAVLLREACTGFAVMSLEVGRAATFLPANPVAFFEVGGPSGPDLHRLAGQLAARDVVRRPAGDREVRPFHPHVTILRSSTGSMLDAVVKALAQFRAPFEARAVDLLELVADTTGEQRWTSIERFPFAGPAVSGRGGVEVAITMSIHRGVLELVARVEGDKVAEAMVWLAGGRLLSIEVDPARRGLGIGARVPAAVEHEARRLELDRLETSPHPFLTRHGWSPRSQETAVRLL